MNPAARPDLLTASAPVDRARGLSRRTLLALGAVAALGVAGAADMGVAGRLGARLARAAGSGSLQPEYYTVVKDYGDYPIAGTVDVYEAEYGQGGRIESLAWTSMGTGADDVPTRSIRCAYSYDAAGYLVQISRTCEGTYDPPEGTQSIALAYDGNGRLVSQLDHSGCGYTATYDENGTIAQVTTRNLVEGNIAETVAEVVYDPQAGTLSFGDWTARFTHAGELASVVKEGWGRKEYVYTPEGKLATIHYDISDFESYDISFDYDGQGMLSGGTRSTVGGNGTHYEYPDAELRGVVFNDAGRGLYWMLANDRNGLMFTHEVSYVSNAPAATAGTGWDWLDLSDPFDPVVVWTPGDALARMQLPTML